ELLFKLADRLLDLGLDLRDRLHPTRNRRKSVLERGHRRRSTCWRQLLRAERAQMPRLAPLENPNGRQPCALLVRFTREPALLVREPTRRFDLHTQSRMLRVQGLALSAQPREFPILRERDINAGERGLRDDLKRGDGFLPWRRDDIRQSDVAGLGE